MSKDIPRTRQSLISMIKKGKVRVSKCGKWVMHRHWLVEVPSRTNSLQTPDTDDLSKSDLRSELLWEAQAEKDPGPFDAKQMLSVTSFKHVFSEASSDGKAIIVFDEKKPYKADDILLRLEGNQDGWVTQTLIDLDYLSSIYQLVKADQVMIAVEPSVPARLFHKGLLKAVICTSLSADIWSS